MFEFVKDISYPFLPESPRVFLTFDIDWAHPDVVLDTYHLISNADIKSTWFATNDSIALNALRDDIKVDLGAHPNFNPLLNSLDELPRKITAKTIASEIHEIVPNAKVFRSHSLVSGSPITTLMKGLGYTHESNFKIPLASGIVPTSILHKTGMIMCPFSWDDYCDHGYSFPPLSSLPDMFICNFHPIHVFLNTECLSRYESTRHLFSNPEELIKHRYHGVGTRDHLLRLLELA